MVAPTFSHPGPLLIKGGESYHFHGFRVRCALRSSNWSVATGSAGAYLTYLGGNSK